jgi:hypothetical protein
LCDTLLMILKIILIFLVRWKRQVATNQNHVTHGDDVWEFSHQLFCQSQVVLVHSWKILSTFIIRPNVNGDCPCSNWLVVEEILMVGI